MENAHYPIILFLTIGLAFNKPIILYKDIMKAFITGVTEVIIYQNT